MKTLRFLCFASLLAITICLAGGGYIGLADEADSVGIATPRQEKLCKAPLALSLISWTADPGGTAADIEASKPPTAQDLPASTTTENLREPEVSGNKSSGTIMITMTGIVGDPGDLGTE